MRIVLVLGSEPWERKQAAIEAIRIEGASRGEYTKPRRSYAIVELASNELEHLFDQKCLLLFVPAPFFPVSSGRLVRFRADVFAAMLRRFVAILPACGPLPFGFVAMPFC